MEKDMNATRVEPLISIIMPAYNSERYIEEAVRSVLAQDHHNWELFIINDGSTDNTGRIIRSFDDPRIHIIDHKKQGIGASRNAGLKQITGQYLITFDSDDVLPEKSLSSRLDIFRQDPGLSFVDGVVHVMDHQLERMIRIYKPNFKGEPLEELAKLTGSCFFGPSWMIKISDDMPLFFNELITHAEDLLFYMTLVKDRRYDYTSATVLKYRRSPNSVMTKLDGLVRSYDYVYRWMLLNPALIEPRLALQFKQRIHRISFRSYLRNLDLWKAFLYLIGARRLKYADVSMHAGSIDGSAMK